MPKKFFKIMWKRQEGITGLETAIILIAFVVVAAVFAYTVLSAGLFATQKSSEAVYSGLSEAKSSLELKGGVILEGVGELDDCNSAWTAGTNITTAADTTAKIEGTGSTRATAGADITAAQVLMTKTLAASRDLTNNNKIYFWVRSSAAILGTAVESLALTLVDATGNSSTDTTTLGALTANTWTKVTWDISAISAANKDIVTAVRLEVAGSGLTITTADQIWVDIVETEPVLSTGTPMKAYTDHVVFTVASTLNGETVDFTTTTDSNNDGDISDETTRTNKVVIFYQDAYQTFTDLAWTKTAVGYDNGNDILDTNEKFQITVDLAKVNNSAANDTQKVGTNSKFTIEVKTPKGAILPIQRTVPAKVMAINNVN